MKGKKLISPFSHLNYNFLTPNKKELNPQIIQFTEKEINRAKVQLELNVILKNIFMAVDCELGIFEFSMQYCLNNQYSYHMIRPIYEEKLNFLIKNLSNKNSYLKMNLLNKTFNPQIIAFMPPDEINPLAFELIRKKIAYIEQREENMASSDAYICNQCGKSKCRVTQVQLRCADEPMTTFVVCMICHNVDRYD